MTTSDEKRILAQLDQAEWALRCLEEGKHKRLSKALSKISANYRVIKERNILDNAHLPKSTDTLDETLHDNSMAVGIIRGGLVEGEPRLTVYSFQDEKDPYANELLRESQRGLINAIFDAIGLKIGKKLEPTFSIFSAKSDDPDEN